MGLFRKQRPEGQRRYSRSVYIGGLPDFTRKHAGTLIFSDDLVGIGSGDLPNVVAVRTGEIASIAVEGAQLGKSKVGPAVVAGVLGATASRDHINQALVSLFLHNGNQAIFAVPTDFAVAVRAEIISWASAREIAAS